MKFEYKPILGDKLFLEVNGNSAETLNLKIQKFREEYEVLREDNPIFSEMVFDLMKKRKWNSTIFKDRTLLDVAAHSRIVNREDRKWKFETVIAICVGLELSLHTTENLLSAAGHAFGVSEKYQAYKFLFTDFRGWSIDECNIFLESVNLPPLGNSTRKCKGE